MKFLNLKQYQRKKWKMQEKKSMELTLLPHLAYEILVEILSRLPVKSLLRFRSVCKQWCSLMIDPQFVSMHLSRSSERHGAILVSATPPQGTLSLHFVDHEASIKDIDDLRLKEYSNINNFNIFGSCNGLLVICNYDGDLLLWNPLTRYCKKIERPLFATNDYVVLHALGYYSDIDNYKVVVAFGRGYSEITYAIIFSSKSNSWKEIEAFPFRISFGGLGTLVNGVPHWKVWPIWKAYHDRIFCFDLVEDKFKEVPQPDWLRKKLRGQLLNFNGWLCNVVHIQSCLEVWAMREYGIQDSWSKIFVIPLLGELRSLGVDCWADWCSAKSGKIIVNINREQKLMVCNPKGSHEVVCCPRSLQLVPYVESLVSPVCFDSM